VNPTAEDCNCIFQVTYGWSDIHDQWEYALEENFMTKQSIEYFKGDHEVSKNLDGTVNYAYNFAVDNNDNKRVSKGCIARLTVNLQTDLVKQIREKGMNNHGVNVTICQSDIAADCKFK
jgi:hypothetical protein